MKKFILAAGVGLAVLVSCEKKEHVQNVEQAEATHTAHGDHGTHDDENADAHDESAELQLNNGEKWTTNSEMEPFITEMKTLLSAYEPQNGNYEKLGADLSAANDQLIKSCTMTGKPHDALHAWLSPHMKEIDKLKKAQSRLEANEVVEDLQESMSRYTQHFK